VPEPQEVVPSIRMFVMWDLRGLPVAYEPGQLARERVRRIAPTSPPHRRDAASSDERGRARARGPRQAYRRAEGLPAERREALVASDIMSAPVTSLGAGLSLGEAGALFERYRFRHLPVIGPRGTPVGMLSDRDLMRLAAMPDAERQTALERTVGDAMTHGVLSAAPGTPIRKIARVLIEEHIGALPIVGEAGELSGIVTRSDILRAVVRHAPLELWT